MDKELRDDFLNKIVASINVNSQQADNEPESSYEDRKSASIAIQKLTRLLIDGVEEISVKEEWPLVEEGDFELTMRMKVRPNSPLSAFLLSLRGSSSVRTSSGVSPVLTGRVCVSIPNILADALSNLTSALPDSALSIAALELLKQESLDSVIALANDSGRLQVVALSRDSQTSSFMSQWADRLLNVVRDNAQDQRNSSGQPASSCLLAIHRVLKGRVASVSVINGHRLVELLLPNESSGEVLVAAGRRSRYPLLDLSVNLKAIAEDDIGGLRDLLSAFERLYARWLFDSQLARFSNRTQLLKSMGLRATFDESDFVSLVSELPADQELKARLKVSVTSRELRGTLRVSRELHRFLLAIDRLAKLRLQAK